MVVQHGEALIKGLAGSIWQHQRAKHLGRPRNWHRIQSLDNTQDLSCWAMEQATDKAARIVNYPRLSSFSCAARAGAE